MPMWTHPVEGQAWLHLCHSLPIKAVLASSDSGDKGTRPALQQEFVAFFIHHISVPTPATPTNTEKLTGGLQRSADFLAKTSVET